jgi:hypothetical protein
VLEKKFPYTYKLELLENLKVHPIFHVSFFKSVACDASKPNQKYNSRPPPNLIDNELEFEMEVVFKSRQLRGQEWEYFVNSKRCHMIEASWVNESNMEYAQEHIKKFHNRPQISKRNVEHDEDITFYLVGEEIA